MQLVNFLTTYSEFITFFFSACGAISAAFFLIVQKSIKPKAVSENMMKVLILSVGCTMIGVGGLFF